MKLTIKDFPQTKLVRREWKGKSYETHDGPFVVLQSDVEEYMPPVIYAKFLEWMSGQTIMSIGQEAGYHLEDIERFLEGKGVID